MKSFIHYIFIILLNDRTIIMRIISSIYSHNPPGFQLYSDKELITINLGLIMMAIDEYYIKIICYLINSS